MSEKEKKQLLETLSNIKSRVNSLVQQYNQLAINSDDYDSKMKVLFDEEVDNYNFLTEDEEDEESWNNSGCSWVSSSADC